MKKIPFDLKFRPEIESGKYKLTSMGHPVEILKWDRRSRDGSCLVGIIKECEDEYIYAWDKDGKYNGNHDYDLMLFSDEPELNKFEVAVKDAMLAWCDPTECTLDDEFVREQAKHIYPIAFSQGIHYIVRDLRLMVAHANDADYDSLVSLHSNLETFIEKNKHWED